MLRMLAFALWLGGGTLLICKALRAFYRLRPTLPVPYWLQLAAVYAVCVWFVATFTVPDVVGAALGETTTQHAAWQPPIPITQGITNGLRMAHLAGVAGVGVRLVHDLLVRLLRTQSPS
jgi:hypothetical protein